MRHFIYFSNKAQTSGNFKDLMKAGRMDIAIHTLIAGLFLSHDVRKDVVMHLVFYGMPCPPRHIEIRVKKGTPISKKDVAGLIKRILYKYREGKKTEVFPGCFIEKKSFLEVVKELHEQGNEIFILDKKGRDIRDLEISENACFVLGDQEGLPQKEMKRLKKILKTVSIGPKMYFASQVVAIVNNEVDRRNI